ncbi:MAG TPA: adenylate/guanylate cyclase domain-containing protein [Nitrososphaerales archaeon]|nr:adenylate/guanylate cyclase domain-containing protein [Nitrososphaerales archaeon]
MFTDLVGYTSITQRDESFAMDLLAEQRNIVRPFLPRHSGREIKTIGDAFLVEFESSLEAARCAFDIQQSLQELNSSRPVERRILIRIGIHLGDVIHTQSDVYGDAVNVASRIEPLAPPGGVCLSEQVYDQIKNKFEFPLSSLGRKELKNVGDLVEVFRVVFPWEKSSAAEPRLDRKRIAVLPFANLSSDQEEGYFADGMTEEMITSLSGVRQLAVIARTSVMKYKGSQKGASEVGRELNAGTLLEGSVRKSGTRVRITAQLIDTATESHLWAQNYDRQLEDVFAIQSEIAEKVAAELKIRLVEDEKRVIEKKATENTEAYTFYLRGRQLLGERSEHSLRQALGLFERAIALDPRFAKAHAGIAMCYVLLTFDSYEPFELAAPKAELSTTKALQLDPELAEAHASRANVDFLEDKMRSGQEHAWRAIELNPSLPEGHWIMANFALGKGDADFGIKSLETAYRLDPVRPDYVDRLGRYYFYLGRENDALQHWEKTVQLAPAATNRNMTEYYLNKGDLEKANEHYTRAEELEPSHRWITWMKGFIAGWKGDREGALRVIREIEEKRFGSTTLNDIGFINYALGDLDSYFAYIDRALDQHTLQYAYVFYCPLLSKSRQDPRYQAIWMKQMRDYEEP